MKALQHVDELLKRLRNTHSVLKSGHCLDGEEDFDVDESHEELRSRDLKLWCPPANVGIPILLVRGTLPSDRLVGVVGSRSVDAYGRSCAREVARLVVDLGFHVLSGGAEGCDAEAHRAALKCGSPTVVVLGHGHDHVYPRHHEELFDEIIRRGGATVSPYWPTVSPRGFRFRERNSVIARLSRAVVVVRARIRSGSLSTARFAQKSGRPVLAIPSNLGDSYGLGCNQLLAEGAIPLVGPVQLADTLRTSTNTIKSWPTNERGSPAPWVEALNQDPATLTSSEEAILQMLKSDALLDLDALHMRSGLSVAELSASLLNLEVQGLIQRTEGDDFLLC